MGRNGKTVVGHFPLNGSFHSAVLCSLKGARDDHKILLENSTTELNLTNLIDP
jgi:hypothetical protein